MTRARLALLGVALITAAASLAYVRSTDGKTNACLYWGPRTVNYRINAGATSTGAPPVSPTCSADVEKVAVDTGFRQWTGNAQGCTDLNLVNDGVPGTTIIGYDRRAGVTNENTVVFRSGWCSVRVGPSDPCHQVDPQAHPEQLSQTCANRFNCFDDTAENGDATLALTTTTYNQSTGEILDADMELNGWDGNGASTSTASSHGWYFTCTDSLQTLCSIFGQGDCTYIDLRNTVTHEAGHFIGLAHAPRPQNPALPVPTMYAFSTPGNLDMRSLEQDDIDGLCAIYPAGKAAVTCVSPSKSGGCASGEGAGITALLLAGAALLPRLRRRR